MILTNIISSISDTIKEARISSPFNKEIYSDDSNNAENEFLFFIKPEITLDDNNIQFDSILELISDKLDEFNFNVKSIRVINAGYLKKHRIINQHYGVIDQISENCRKYISEEAKSTFKEIFNESFETANVYGSKELLKKYSFLTPASLSFAWQNNTIRKLSGGTYAQKHKYDGETIYILNGFHPRQLEYFTTTGRCIIVFTLESDTDWSVARNKFIGKTNAPEADLGSIRRELAINKDKLGLVNIDSTWNGVHLSASPVESLVELIRYNSDFENGKILDVSDFKFGKDLIETFDLEKVRKIIDNPTVNFNEKKSSVFDFTEELNSPECLELLKGVFKHDN